LGNGLARHIAMLTTLRFLSIHGEAPLEDLLLFTFLERLEFKLCSGVNTHFISQLCNLRELIIDRCPLIETEFQWTQLCALTNLKSLRVTPPQLNDWNEEVVIPSEGIPISLSLSLNSHFRFYPFHSFSLVYIFEGALFV
jgi:hypothetical protein